MRIRKLNKKYHGKLIGVLLCLLGSGFIIVNMLNMYRYLNGQVREWGEVRLGEISNDMQHTLEKSKLSLLKFASDVEVYMATDTEYDVLNKYLENQSKVFSDKSEDTLMNAYICTKDRMMLSNSVLPDDYVLTEREWYKSTIKNGIDNIYTSPPYQDAFTGELCFTMALLISDGETVVAMDFNLAQIQKSMEKMHRELGGESLIISKDGTIVGYSDSSCLGKKLTEVMPEYTNVYRSLLNEKKNSLLIDTYINDVKCTSFCDRSGEWFFVYTIDNKALYSDMNRIMLLNFVPRITMLIGMIAYCLYVYGFRHSEEHTAVQIPEQLRNEKDDVIIAGADDINKFTRKSRNKVMSVLIVTSLLAFIFSGIVLVSWGNDRMERNVDSYSYQLESWMNKQRQTLNMFVDTIAANPSVLDDYDYAVEYLDKIVQKHPDISAAFIARPGNEHEMTMNNGWVPNADYVVAERQWYIDTENSDNGTSVSSPYLDVRTGLYCMTFSKIVYDADTEKQIGVFALDFYIENLTNIMVESYSDDGYAFLIDNSDIIINHPNPEYQISSEKTLNIDNTEYQNVKSSTGVHFIRDYDGKFKVCIYRTEPDTGFSVIAVKDVLSIYGVVAACGGFFIALLILCIILLYRMIIHTMKWQEKNRLALIEEARRASQADQAKSSFLAQMSHEIRTPINAVLGMNEMILRESKEENTLNYASNAYNAGSALLSIINDILDISKIEAGKLEITETEYDLYSLISNCYHMTAKRAENKGLEFNVICDESLPSKLMGDMFHIRQITVNMITNAVKYTDKGFVELRFSGIETENGFALCIAVKDTGIGLKPESLEKLFTSFQRFDLEHNQTIEGTGLGLSICKQLAELMKGSIKAESVYGEGSVFTCVIPQQVVNSTALGKIQIDRTAEKIDVEEQNRFTAPDARILAVDDVEMNLVVFKSFLKSHEMQIDTALSGKQCLEMTAVNSYDIIFMDHMMPEMDGIETYKKMREMNYIDSDTPVVMLTANAILGEEEKYLSIGFNSYLTKPIQSKKLEEMLLKFLPEQKIIYAEEQAEAVQETEAEAESEAESVTEPEPKSEPETSENDMFDISVGLMYSGDDKDMYFKVLKMYISSDEDRGGKIREFMMSESWKDYITEVHALKSTSLMVGAKKLSEAAKELELAGREGNYELIRKKNDSLLKLYEKVISIINDYLISEGVSDNIPTESDSEDDSLVDISDEKFKEFIAHLVKACENFDDDEAGRICGEASKHSFRQIPLEPYFNEVMDLVENFYYDEACQKAESIFDEVSRNIN